MRNGYHYGTTSAIVEGQGLTTNAGSHGIAAARAEENAQAAALNLVPKVEALAVELRRDLEAKRLTAAR